MISEEGIKVRIKERTFLGKYTNYELEFGNGMAIENQPSLEYSQDVGQASKIYEAGETITLKPNALKINVFTEDGKQSLIKGCE
jgi:iron(III) transport system ATP-binding protein